MVEKLNVDKLLKQFPPRFEAKPYYLRTNDAAYFFHEDTEYYAERIDCWLTVYRRCADGGLVGFKIKNIRILLSKFDALGLVCRTTDNEWQIMLQPMLAFIPVAVEPPMENLERYRDVLTSFGRDLSSPLELTPA